MLFFLIFCEYCIRIIFKLLQQYSMLYIIDVTYDKDKTNKIDFVHFTGIFRPGLRRIGNETGETKFQYH